MRETVALPELVPEGRAFFVAPSESGHRVWMLSRSVPTLADELQAATGNKEKIARLLLLARRAAASLREAGRDPAVRGGCAAFAEQEGRVVLLAVDAQRGETIAPDIHAARLAGESP